MTHYQLQWQPYSHATTWEYNFRQPSDNMARASAEKIATAMLSLSPSGKIQLWSLDGPGKLLATYLLHQPKAYIQQEQQEEL